MYLTCCATLQYTALYYRVWWQNCCTCNTIAATTIQEYTTGLVQKQTAGQLCKTTLHSLSVQSVSLAHKAQSERDSYLPAVHHGMALHVTS